MLIQLIFKGYLTTITNFLKKIRGKSCSELLTWECDDEGVLYVKIIFSF